MTLLQALAKSEEMSCFVVHPKTGNRLKIPKEAPAFVANFLRRHLTTLDYMAEGWELDDTPTPVHIDTEFAGCDAMDCPTMEKGTILSFRGAPFNIPYPDGTKVRLTLEPL